MGREQQLKPRWFARASCRGRAHKDGSYLFFSEDPRKKAIAKTICGSCPVREHCLVYALNHDVDGGVFGGFDHREREALLARWRGRANQEIARLAIRNSRGRARKL